MKSLSRPWQRIVGITTLGISFVAGAQSLPTIPPSTAPSTGIVASNPARPPKGFLNSPTKEEIHHVFADEIKSGAKLVWYSDPAKIDSSRQAFLTSLAEDCQKLRIPVPQVFVLEPKFINGLPDPHFKMGLSADGYDFDFGFYIVFRSDLLNPSKSNFSYNELQAYAVRGHELGHIRNALMGLHYPSALAEELAADKVSVALGYGKPLAEALEIDESIKRKAFYMFFAKYYPGKTYDEASQISSAISSDSHPTFAARQADIAKLIADGKDSLLALQSDANPSKETSPISNASANLRSIPLKPVVIKPFRKPLR